MPIEALDARRARVLVGAVRDAVRMRNPLVLPVAIGARYLKRLFTYPVDSALMYAMATPGSVVSLDTLKPLVKEMDDRQFNELVLAVKSGDIDKFDRMTRPLRLFSTAAAAPGALKGIAKKLNPLPSMRRSVRSIRYDLGTPLERSLMERGIKGGTGSGNFGHTGRIGGGSNPTIPHGGVFSGIQATTPGFRERKQ